MANESISEEIKQFFIAALSCFRYNKVFANKKQFVTHCKR